MLRHLIRDASEQVAVIDLEIEKLQEEKSKLKLKIQELKGLEDTLKATPEQ
ncbi:MAG: hypothetical protein QNJ36_09020 [Calothrix sp. MO_167.B42]|nr:hypothetical protein [Calothrix sp. MO_167.B42]